MALNLLKSSKVTKNITMFSFLRVNAEPKYLRTGNIMMQTGN